MIHCHECPPHVSFVADQATFTPEKIETRSDRLGQVYRAKVRILAEVERFQPGTEGNVYFVATGDGSDTHGVAADAHAHGIADAGDTNGADRAPGAETR